MRSIFWIIALACFVQTRAREAAMKGIDAHDSMNKSSTKLKSLNSNVGIMSILANSSAFPRRMRSLREKAKAKSIMPFPRRLTFHMPRTVSQWDIDAEGKVPLLSDHVGNAKAIFNLINNIVGSGVLSLPAGVAAIGGERALLFPAMLLMTVMGSLCCYTFYSIGRQCGISGGTTFIKAWAESVSKRSAWIVMLVAIVYPVMGCLCYSIIIGDSFSDLAKSGILGPWLERSPIATDRRTWILSFAVAVLYPLSSLRKLSSLALPSLLAVLSVAYTAIFMMVRCFDGSYQPGGCFYDSLSIKPSFDTNPDGFLFALKKVVSRFGTLILLGMSETSYVAHLNAPAFYDEANRDNGKFRLIVGLGFLVSILLNLVFLGSGFLTFGTSSAGSILNSYARNDVFANVARALFGVCVITSYPVVFQGLKPALKAGLFKKMEDSFLLDQAITVLAMILITAPALLVSDLGLASTLTGAIGGSALIFIFPSLMYLRRPSPAMYRSSLEKVGNMALLVFGFLLAVLGVIAAFMPQKNVTTMTTTTTAWFLANLTAISL